MFGIRSLKITLALAVVLTVTIAHAQSDSYLRMVGDGAVDRYSYADQPGAAPVFGMPSDFSVAPVGYMQPQPTMAGEMVPVEEPSLAQPAMAVDPAACGMAPCGVDACMPACEPKCNPWFVRGWVDQGFTYNDNDPQFGWNDPMGFNDRSNEYQLNQLYLSMGKAIDRGCSWGFGGRVDLLYGTDYRYAQSLGLEAYRDDLTDNRWNGSQGPARLVTQGTGQLVFDDQSLYGLAMPQLYGEVYAPIAGGISLKMGHFYSIIGYESVMSPKNFFYSHSYSLIYGEPKTSTGMLMSTKLGDTITLHAGMTRGWDAWEPRPGIDHLGFLGGVQWESCNKQTTLGFAISATMEPAAPINTAPTATTRSVYSLVFTHNITPRLQYVLQHDGGYQDDAFVYSVFGGNSEIRDTQWYSLNQYMYYTLTERLSLGVRYEWMYDKYATMVTNQKSFSTLTGGFTGNEVNELTVGLNWKPLQCMTIRPEARWDWSDIQGTGAGFSQITGLYNDQTLKSQFTMGVDMVLVY